MPSIKGLFKNKEVAISSTEDGHLQVEAIVEPGIEHASGDGDSFAWPSLNTNIVAGDTRLIVRNTSDRILKLEYLVGNPANVSASYNLGIGTSTTAFTVGTAVVAINLNETFNTRTFDYDAMDGDTAIADAAILMFFQVSTVESIIIPLQGVILGKNAFIQINQETESTSGQITLFGHFDEAG